MLENDYRHTIKNRLAGLRSRKPGWTLKKLARQIDIQYTYLSKALNDPSTHLSEEHLFTVCQVLEILPEEMEYLLLQRAYQVAVGEDRRKYLFGRLERMKRERKLDAKVEVHQSSKLMSEMNYLFEPLCMLIHIALCIDQFKKEPKRLCGVLGLEILQLKSILKKLEQNDFIELEDDGIHIKKLLGSNIHYTPDHPLMRVHQNLLKTLAQSQILRTTEDKKKTFLATFTADQNEFENIKDEFQTFLKRVEKISKKSQAKHVYQLNFDLFEWL